jgi:tetratricopeptide (TPR) repeat protein
MKRIKIQLLLFTFLLGKFTYSQPDNLQKGIDLFYKRAEGSKDLLAKPGIINEAIAIFEKELLALNQPEKSGLYYLLSLNFKARFVCRTESEKKSVLTKAVKIAELLKNQFPKSGPICFEYITSMGLLAEISGSFKSAADGVVGKMKANAEALIEIDSMYNSGAGWKVLGILHYRTPNLGIILNWADKKYARLLLEKALHYYPNDIANNFYYAEALVENDEKENAVRYFKLLLKLPPRKDFILEDLDFKARALMALQELNKK